MHGGNLVFFFLVLRGWVFIFAHMGFDFLGTLRDM